MQGTEARHRATITKHVRGSVFEYSPKGLGPRSPRFPESVQAGEAQRVLEHSLDGVILTAGCLLLLAGMLRACFPPLGVLELLWLLLYGVRRASRVAGEPLGVRIGWGGWSSAIKRVSFAWRNGNQSDSSSTMTPGNL